MELAAKRQPLYRDPENGLLGGICAGIAERLNIDVLLARTTAIVLSLLTFGVAVAIYLIMWVIIPSRSRRSGVIDVRPRNASSERYDKVIAAKAAAKRESAGGALYDQRSSSGSTESVTRKTRTISTAPQRSSDYRFSLILLALFCFLITLAIAALINANDAVAFTEFLPLYLVPIGIFFVAAPGVKRSFVARICAMILCFEFCAVLLPFSIGICNLESFEIISSSSYLLWAIALVFFIVGLALDSNISLILAIVLVFFATGSTFFDLGFLDPRPYLSAG